MAHSKDQKVLRSFEMIFKITGLLVLSLIIYSEFALSSSQTCGNYNGTRYTVVSSNHGLPSKTNRKNEARTIFSGIKLFASKVNSCSIYNNKKKFIKIYF